MSNKFYKIYFLSEESEMELSTQKDCHYWVDIFGPAVVEVWSLPKKSSKLLGKVRLSP